MSMYGTISAVTRFLIVVIPVTARLWPAVAIGDALAAGGHDVAWCGPQTVLRPLVGPDATIFPTGKRSYRAFHEVGLAAVRELWDEYVVPLNRFIQAPVDRAVAEYQPDVILADQYALAGALAADKHGVRWATLCAGALELTPPAGDPGLQDWVNTKLEQVREAAGAPADGQENLLFSPYLVLATTTRALTGPVPMPGHWVLVGATLGPRRTDPSFGWDQWDCGRRHVLVTMGTLSDHLVHGFLTRMMAALETMADRVQVVLNAPADAVPDPPPHVLVAPRIPMLELMPHLDLVVCSGGQSTVNESLVHGVPLILAPIRLGELAVAEQVRRAGAGLTVSFDQGDPAHLAAAVTAVLDEPGYRGQARRISEEYSAAGGTAAAAAALAALADGGAALAGSTPALAQAAAASRRSVRPGPASDHCRLSRLEGADGR
jgi:zeaxanthin glucosyltransferase